jgi:hypothetical protein
MTLNPHFAEIAISTKKRRHPLAMEIDRTAKPLSVGKKDTNRDQAHGIAVPHIPGSEAGKFNRRVKPLMGQNEARSQLERTKDYDEKSNYRQMF